MSVAAAQVRNEVQFMVRRIVQPIQAHELSVKAQHNKAARLTGLPPRRIKDLWHGYVNSIPAHQDRTIRAAYQKWLEAAKARALAELKDIEAENERLSTAAADYVSSSWRRACEGRTEDRALGGAAVAASNDD